MEILNPLPGLQNLRFHFASIAWRSGHARPMIRILVKAGEKFRLFPNYFISHLRVRNSVRHALVVQKSPRPV